MHPAVHGTVFDQPSLREDASLAIEASGLSSRCQFVGGNFLDSVPGDGDLYLLRFVLHDWPDSGATRILQEVRNAMKPDAQLVIMEGVLDANPDAVGELALRNIEQMAWTGGRVRPRTAFDALTAAAGLAIYRVEPTEIVDCHLLYVVPV